MALRNLTRLLALAVLSIALAPMTTHAQASPPASPAATTPPGTTVVATGLVNPRGIAWDANGAMYVAQAGTGGTSPATEEWPTANAVGPWLGGMSASVARIEGGCPVKLVGSLPSSIDATEAVLGAEEVAFLGEDVYVGVDGGGGAHGNPDGPSGIYRLGQDGTAELVADLSAWVRANPVATIPADQDPDAAGYSVVADPDAGLLWVSDPNSSQILTVAPDGTVARVADLSENHPVPTKMTLAPGGGVYVGTLTPLPYLDGSAKVMHVAPDGTVTDVWTGLTAVMDVAIGPDGTLYAAELSTGNLKEPPFMVPESGRIVRQTGPDSLEVVAAGLPFPAALDVGPDGALYLSQPAVGANTGEGTILRLPLTGETPPAATPPACPPTATPAS